MPSPIRQALRPEIRQSVGVSFSAADLDNLKDQSAEAEAVVTFGSLQDVASPVSPGHPAGELSAWIGDLDARGVTGVP